MAATAQRVVLVDARDGRREVMRHVVEGDETQAILVGEASDRAGAVAVVDQENADVVILDVAMPLSEGLATIATLREHYPHLGIVVCSFDLDGATVRRVLAAGADGVLAKPVGRPAVHTALSGLPDHDRQADDRPRVSVPACG